MRYMRNLFQSAGRETSFNLIKGYFLTVSAPTIRPTIPSGFVSFVILSATLNPLRIITSLSVTENISCT